MLFPIAAMAGRVALGAGARTAVRGAGRAGARTALMATRASITGARLAVAGGVAVTAAGINAARRSSQNNRMAQNQAQAIALRNSSSSATTATFSGGFGHLMNNSFLLFGLGVLLFLNFSSVTDIFELTIQNVFLFLNLITPFNIQTTGMFATFDVSMLALTYVGLILLVILSYSFFRHKAEGVVVASLWTIGYPFLVYFAFIGFGASYLGPSAVEQTSNYLMMSTFVLIGLFFIAFLITNDSTEYSAKVMSIVKLITIILIFLWIALFLMSGSAQSLIFQERADQEVQQVSEGARSFQLYIECTVLAGEARNLPKCMEVEEETQVRRDTQEPFIFEAIRDSGNSVIREGRETVQFNFFISTPRPIDVRLTGYSCMVGTNRTRYEVPSEFNHLTNSIPFTGTNFRVECPVVDKLRRSDFRSGTVTVYARVYFEVKDTIHQSMPYVNCAHPYFSTVDFDCSNLAREFWLGNIDNTNVLSFMNSITDRVSGMYSTRGSVVSLRGVLPLYLNDPTDSSFTEIDYSIKFQEHQQLTIRSITLDSFRTPDYITINEDSLIRNLVSTDMNVNKELQFPIEFRINDVQRDDIGSTEVVSYNFILNQSFETSRRIIIDSSLFPEDEDNTPTTIDDIVDDTENGDDSNGNGTGEDNDENNDDSDNSNGDGIGGDNGDSDLENPEDEEPDTQGGDDCIAICTPQNSACIRECREGS